MENREQSKIKKSSDYYEKFHRNGSISAWLDETLEDILNHLEEILNEEDIKRKNRKLKSLMSYLNGIQDGNRFGKPNPYNKKNPKLSDKKGTRII